MNDHQRITRYAATAIVLFAGIGIGVFGASKAQSDTMYFACVTAKGEMQDVGTVAPTCKPSERLISWNQQGPTGPQGPQGPAGVNVLPLATAAWTFDLPSDATVHRDAVVCPRGYEQNIGGGYQILAKDTIPLGNTSGSDIVSPPISSGVEVLTSQPYANPSIAPNAPSGDGSVSGWTVDVLNNSGTALEITVFVQCVPYHPQ